VLGVEADAAARATAGRLRRAVDDAVTRAGSEAGSGTGTGTGSETDRHAPWAIAAGAPDDGHRAQG